MYHPYNRSALAVIGAICFLFLNLNMACQEGVDDDDSAGYDEELCPDGDQTDIDEDGHIGIDCGGDDCDDLSDAVHPEAEEICDNEIDDDCDGLIDMEDDDCDEGDDDTGGDDDATGDDDDTTPMDHDQDGDGYDGTLFGGDDCDDSDPNVNPGMSEYCNDGIDNDCNGSMDCQDQHCMNTQSDCWIDILSVTVTCSDNAYWRFGESNNYGGPNGEYESEDINNALCLGLWLGIPSTCDLTDSPAMVMWGLGCTQSELDQGYSRCGYLAYRDPAACGNPKPDLGPFSEFGFNNM